MAQFFPCAVLCVDVVHSAFPDRRWAELRFPASMTVEAAQDKLYHHTGTPPSRMKLYAYTPGREDEGIYLGHELTKTLDDVGVRNGMELLVVDTQQEGLSVMSSPEMKQKLFFLSDEDYEKRPDNARVFLRQLRRHVSQPDPSASNNASFTDDASSLAPGQRCEVFALGGVRGEVVSIGSRPNAKGQWIGIKLDEPLGNAVVPGCPEGYGCYISTKHWKSKLQVGDFPPEDLMELL